MVTLSSVFSTKSGLAMDVDMLVGKVAGGDSQDLKPNRLAYSLEQQEISSETRETRQLSTESCLQVYRL